MRESNELIKRLRGIVYDFEGQKEHFEFEQADAIAVRNAADMIERLLPVLKTAKIEAYKEFAEKFVQKAEKTKIIYIADTTIQEQETGWYQISIADFDNLLKVVKEEHEN